MIDVCVYFVRDMHTTNIGNTTDKATWMPKQAASCIVCALVFTLDLLLSLVYTILALNVLKKKHFFVSSLME